MPTAFGFRPHISRHTMRSGLPVCIIATYNSAGNFMPIYFGIELDGMRYRYKIKSATVIKDSHGEITFDCDYADMGRIKTVRLVFDVIGCQWVVG